jgi:hypothetical protein
MGSRKVRSAGGTGPAWPYQPDTWEHFRKVCRSRVAKRKKRAARKRIEKEQTNAKS